VLEWVTAAAGTATVQSDTGMITGVAVGSTTVTVRSKTNTSVKADVTVNVVAATVNSKIIWSWKIGDTAPKAKDTSSTTANDINGKTVYGNNAVTIASSHSNTNIPDGAMVINNNRFWIGLPQSPTWNITALTNGIPSAESDANAAYCTNAQLELNKPFKITVKGGRSAGTGFSINLNNARNANNGGVLKGPSDTSVPNANGAVANPLGVLNAGTDVYVFRIDPSTLSVKTEGLALTPPVTAAAVLPTQFIQFRADGSSTGWIEEIIIEYE